MRPKLCAIDATFIPGSLVVRCLRKSNTAWTISTAPRAEAEAPAAAVADDEGKSTPSTLMRSLALGPSRNSLSDRARGR
jgi:hypothetical protein